LWWLGYDCDTIIVKGWQLTDHRKDHKKEEEGKKRKKPPNDRSNFVCSTSPSDDSALKIENESNCGSEGVLMSLEGPVLMSLEGPLYLYRYLYSAVLYSSPIRVKLHFSGLNSSPPPGDFGLVSITTPIVLSLKKLR
jgi:hypothetical protein